MCITLTPVLIFLYIAINEVNLQCFTESVSLRDIGKLTSRAEISRPSSLYYKAVNGAHLGSGATSELTNSNGKKIHRKHTILFWERNLDLVYIILKFSYT